MGFFLSVIQEVSLEKFIFFIPRLHLLQFLKWKGPECRKKELNRELSRKFNNEPVTKTFLLNYFTKEDKISLKSNMYL